MQRFTFIFLLYVVLGAAGVNIAGNMMSQTAAAIEQRQQSRIEKLCKVNPVYCY